MVKKKSFWLTLLAVLTAAVLVFSACGLAACSSESNDDGATVSSVSLDKTSLSLTVGGSAGSLTATVKMSDDSAYGGDYTWSSDKESVAKVSGNGTTATVTAVAEGSATITVAVSDNMSASCTVTVKEAGEEGDEDLLVALHGYYDVLGMFGFWAEVEMYTDGTGFFNTVNSDGSLYEDFCGTLDWTCETGYDIEDDYVELDSYITLDTYGRVGIPGSLARVNGEIVASYFSIQMISSESIFYAVGVTAALESKGNVGDEHAKTVLYDNGDCVVQIDGEAEEGTWAWNDAGDNVTLTVGSSTYSTSSVVSNDKGQITSAVFSNFGGVSNITFLQILDAELEDTTLYQFVSGEGYTLVLDEDGTYVSVVGGTTYTGDYYLTSTSLDMTDGTDSSTYTATVVIDEDGNMTLTFETYYGDATNVVFEIGVPFNREDSANYQKYYKGDWDSETVTDEEGNETKVTVDHGEAIAVMVGNAYSDDDDGNPVKTDDTEYWVFLYRDGVMAAHISDASDTFKTDGSWCWSTNDDNELVPTFIRNPGATNEQINYASDNGDGTWSVRINSMMTTMPSYLGGGGYYIYTFSLEDMPAGAFEGTNASGTTTVYLVLNYDGTFTAHINSGLMTSTGVWSKDDDGKMQFYKTNSSGAISALCDMTVDEDGIYTVVITNAIGSKYTYTVDSGVVPVGGHVYTDADKATIEELEAEAQGSGEETPEDVTYVDATLYTESFTVYGMSATDVTLYLKSDGSASLDLTIMGSEVPFSNCSYSISGDSISLTVSSFGAAIGTITYAGDDSIESITFTEFAGTTQSITFTVTTT